LAWAVVRRGTLHGAPVAVKTLSPDAADVGDAPARAFEAEMRVLAALRHPHIIGVYGKSRLPDGRVALMQELVPGGSL
jgi:serine/threonine protein kinase